MTDRCVREGYEPAAASRLQISSRWIRFLLSRRCCRSAGRPRYPLPQAGLFGRTHSSGTCQAHHRLDEITLDYLVLDASFFQDAPRLTGPAGAGPLGRHHEGKPLLVGLTPDSGESSDGCAGILTDLRDSGLTSPLLIVGDDTKGLIAAIEQVFPKTPQSSDPFPGISRYRNHEMSVPTSDRRGRNRIVELLRKL